MPSASTQSPPVVLPGIEIPAHYLPIPSNPNQSLKLGPGLVHIPPSTITPTFAGTVHKDVKKHAVWVESSSGRVSLGLSMLVPAAALSLLKLEFKVPKLATSTQACPLHRANPMLIARLACPLTRRYRPRNSPTLVQRSLRPFASAILTTSLPRALVVRERKQENSTPARTRCARLRARPLSLQTHRHRTHMRQPRNW